MSIDRVLLVDDDPDIRRIGCLSLERVGGWTVVAVASGAECLARAPEFEPDLILIDVMMPGTDGPTTLRELRRDPALRQIPVVLMSAAVTPKLAAGFRELGAQGVIEKPFDPLSLPARLRELVGD